MPGPFLPSGSSSLEDGRNYSCSCSWSEGPNSREQVTGRNNAIKLDGRCREPALWATQARPVRLLKGGKHTWVLVAARATKGPNDHQVELSELACMSNRRRLVNRLRARVDLGSGRRARAVGLLTEIDDLIGKVDLPALAKRLLLR